MKIFKRRTCVFAALLLFHTAAHAAAQGSLELPVTATSAKGATFKGSIAVTKFEARGTEIVAIGFISGTLTHRNRIVGTALVGEVAVPVTVKAGGFAVINGIAAERPQLRSVAFSPANTGRGGLTMMQAAACPVVDIVLGPFTVNVLGVDLTLQPVEIDLVGEPGTPLGDLVCQVNELIGNVAGLVGVLNTILNLLILLLGGGLVLPGI